MFRLMRVINLYSSKIFDVRTQLSIGVRVTCSCRRGLKSRRVGIGRERKNEGESRAHFETRHECVH